MNKLHHPVKIKPTSTFYALYTNPQQLDIINSLENYREIPVQYSYFGEGAKHWDAYVKRLASEKNPNSLNYTIDLLKIGQSYIGNWITRFDNVNLVDIGVGNSMHVRALLEYLQKTGKFGRYIGLDLSPSILALSQANLLTWFGNTFNYEEHLIDINYDRFNHVLSNEYLGSTQRKTTNIILSTGGMIENLRSPDAAHRIINDSMGRNDLFIDAHKLDTSVSRKYFSFGADTIIDKPSPHDRAVLELLDIHQGLYNMEMGYDPIKMRRYIQVRLKQDISVQFEFLNGIRTVNLTAGETILLWYFWHQTPTVAVKAFEDSNFEVIQMTQTTDQQYVMVMGKIKT